MVDKGITGETVTGPAVTVYEGLLTVERYEVTLSSSGPSPLLLSRSALRSVRHRLLSLGDKVTLTPGNNTQFMTDSQTLVRFCTLDTLFQFDYVRVSLTVQVLLLTSVCTLLSSLILWPTERYPERDRVRQPPS